ncbi:MAG: FmdB family zinc ribbon protein [Planctomycetota bacterium]|jgi:putative FmdB family regulatory protein
MPTYDYECSFCGHRFEVFERVGAGTRKKCPECGRRRARRRIGAGAGILFRGSGFYTTDYARKGRRPSEDGKEEKGKEVSSGAGTRRKTKRKTKRKTVRKKK